MLPTSSELARLEPVGEGNREPLFLVRDATVDSLDVVGQGHLKLALRTRGGVFTAFGWELGDLAPEIGGSVDLFGSLRPDSWRGGDAIEMRIQGSRLKLACRPRRPSRNR